MNGKQALDKLLEGNRRYLAGECAGEDRHAEKRAATVCGQDPFAIVLGCSDSRVPPEIIFDSGIGELFVVRVAGEEEGHMGAVLCELCEAVEASKNNCTEGYKIEEIVLAAVKENALMIARRLREAEPILRKLVDNGSLLVEAALYDIESGTVSLLT